MSEHLVSIHRARKTSVLASSGRWDKAPIPTAKAPLIISASELGAFLRCRVKHDLGYRHQLEPKTVDPERGLGMGILGHDIVDQWYQVPWVERTVQKMERIAKRLTKQARLEDLTSQQRTLIMAMCVGYAKMCLGSGADNFPSDKDIGLKKAKVFPEEWFEVPLVKDGSILVRGRFDARFQPTTDKGQMALLETKTRGQFRDEYLEQTLQLTVYLFAMRQKFPGYERYTVYFQRMRKQMPTARVTAPLFDRQEIDRDESQLDQWAIDASHAAQDMLDGSIYPNPMDSCNWMCEFKGPCLLRGNSSDLKHVLKTQFKLREKR